MFLSLVAKTNELSQLKNSNSTKSTSIRPLLSPTPHTSRKLSGSNHTTIETNVLKKSVDEKGNHRINNYIVLHEIGRGGFGKVKLVYS